MPANRHQILSALDEPVLLIDTARTILFANEAAHALLGKGIDGTQLVRVVRHPEAIRCVSAVLSGQDRSMAQFHLEVPHRTAFRLTAVRLVDDEAAAALVLKDISPLLEAEQMRSDFVANVSHELRSPLTTLAGLIETLQGSARNDPKAQVRFLETMGREAARMDRLIDDLLSLSRVEAQERVRPTASVDLSAVITDVVASLQERGDFEGRDLNINLADNTATVLGDADQLTQVFQNLIENAAKYSKPEGTISIALERRDKALGFSTPVFIASVTDEGQGIAPEHLPRLTERFYRVDSGRSRQKGGTGLGLAIVKHILSRHRGRLIVSSEVGKGSKFSVLLPALKLPTAG
ncbi:ATP-binding protein [Pseudahrensia aquimaris]|uniref:histidine kinase n=1 Tax=Pseudahrensia aquimaris TaxID=744461 RepID=A0ABW3FEU4_9HYPH